MSQQSTAQASPTPSSAAYLPLGERSGNSSGSAPEWLGELDALRALGNLPPAWLLYLTMDYPFGPGALANRRHRTRCWSKTCRGMFSKDFQGRFVFANRHMGSEFVRPLEETLGRTDLGFFPEALAAG